MKSGFETASKQERQEKWATKGDLEMAETWERFGKRLDRLADESPSPSKMEPGPTARAR